MAKCYKHLLNEIELLGPTLVFLLGTKVRDFVAKTEKVSTNTLDKSFKYKKTSLYGTIVVPIHHPSYILIYKRKLVESYISSVSDICAEYGITRRSTGPECRRELLV
jgi:DNA polymerase